MSTTEGVISHIPQGLVDCNQHIYSIGTRKNHGVYCKLKTTIHGILFPRIYQHAVIYDTGGLGEQQNGFIYNGTAAYSSGITGCCNN